jgi:thiol-disulfide isomerase/thioredoxin
LKDLEGREIQLKSLRGNVVLLNFWATWCGPCRLEMPVIEKLHQQFHGKGLRVFGVNDEEIETIRDTLQSTNIVSQPSSIQTSRL